MIGNRSMMDRLSIAKKIVEAHHGEIQVRSVVGEGSTFRVLLPIMKAK